MCNILFAYTFINFHSWMMSSLISVSRAFNVAMNSSGKLAVPLPNMPSMRTHGTRVFPSMVDGLEISLYPSFHVK